MDHGGDGTGAPRDPYAVGADEAVERLLMLAIEQRVGRRVGAEALVQAALVALVVEVDSPALRELAGLGRGEDARSRELFWQVVEELGLAARIPDDGRDAHWAMVRWWLRLIVDGGTDAVAGGRLISNEAWGPLGEPAALRPFVAWTSEYDDWNEDWETPRDAFRQRIVDDARALLAGPWPPLV